MRKHLRALICICMILFLCGSMVLLPGAQEYAGPTLFHNDEAWFKDSLVPLRSKNGIYHIPTDFLSMFTGISVSYRDNGNNMLIQRGDAYVSILYHNQTAIVNGNLVSGVSVFRQNGYYYVDAAWIAGILGLRCTYSTDGSGQVTLRVTNGEERRTMEELLAAYSTGEIYEDTTDWEDVPPEAETVKRVYIVTGDNWENPAFPDPMEICTNSNLQCTVFFHEKSNIEKVIEYGIQGKHGICAGSVEEADAINEILYAATLHRCAYVLPADKNTDRKALTEAGYVVVEPNFIVNYQTDPDLLYTHIVSYMETADSAVVQVSGDGCSQRLLALLCNLTADPNYCISDVLLP